MRPYLQALTPDGLRKLGPSVEHIGRRRGPGRAQAGRLPAARSTEQMTASAPGGRRLPLVQLGMTAVALVQRPHLRTAQARDAACGLGARQQAVGCFGGQSVAVIGLSVGAVMTWRLEEVKCRGE